MPDPPQAGRPLEVRVSLGVGAIQSATIRICHEAGVPIDEVLLLRGQGGTWVGVIDGRLVKSPRIGLWVRVRQRGAYRGVLGSVDDPVWVQVGEQGVDVRPSQRSGGSGLLAIQQGNRRPHFGFPDYSPAMSLARLMDREGDRFSRRRQDGRQVALSRGRFSDRAEALRLDLIDLMDPYDGSLVDFVDLGPSYDHQVAWGRMDLERRYSGGWHGRLQSDQIGRSKMHVAYARGRHRLIADATLALEPSGLEVLSDHSDSLPSRYDDRRIDDRGRGMLLLWRGEGAQGLRASAGILHRADAGYMGLWDTLTHGEWRQRNALLFGLQRLPDRAAPWQAELDLNLGLWQHDDQRVVAGPGLALRDADGDGLLEQFPDGIRFRLQQQLWHGRLALAVSRGRAGLRLGARLSADTAGVLGGVVTANRSDNGVALGQLESHPILGDRRSFIDGYGTGEGTAQWRQGAWRVAGRFGAVVAPEIDRLWTGSLGVQHVLPGRKLGLKVWSKPQRRLLDRHYAPDGYLAQNMSEPIPYGASLLDREKRIRSPFSEGVRLDTYAQRSSSSGVWLYGANVGVEELAHSSDGVDRSGSAQAYADDGSIRSYWLSGRMDFAAFGGLRFHGSVWLGQSFAQRIEQRGDEAPDLDQPWVRLSEVPVWRWRNRITQVIAKQWMTGGGLEAISPLSNSDRSPLTTLHSFELPSQLRIDAWLRYQRGDLGVVLRAENAMEPYHVMPLPRPDRVPGLLPVAARQVLLGVEWQPGGRRGKPEPFQGHERN